MIDSLTSDIILDYIPESLIVLNPADQIVYYNERAEQYQKLAKANFGVGVPFQNLVSSDRQEIVRHILKQVKRERIAQSTESEYKDSNGQSHFFEATYSPVISPANELMYIFVIFREITHQKIFEKKSVQLLYDLNDLIESANAVIFSIDSRQYITEWNRECSRITGYSKSEVLAQQILAFVADDMREQFDLLFAKIVNGEALNNFELRFKTSENSFVNFFVNATPKTNGAGHVVGVLFVGHDITELSLYRQSLEQQVKDRTEKLQQALLKEKELVEIKNRFVSMASHEFGIPLSTINFSLRLLKSNHALRQEDLERITTIENQVRHMKSLIEDVLTLGKSDVARLKANSKSVDIIDLLRAIAHEVTINAEHSHRILIEYEDGEIFIESDEKLLRNIFINLLSNAIKFSPRSDKVQVCVQKLSDSIEISVIDEGMGIDERELGKIFEPFNRGSNVEQIRGTGLGLSIVKKAVEALNGTINISSALGHGTIVTVKLNVKQNERSH